MIYRHVKIGDLFVANNVVTVFRAKASESTSDFDLTEDLGDLYENDIAMALCKPCKCERTEFSEAWWEVQCLTHLGVGWICINELRKTQ